MLLIIIGPDGSGKTTIANEIIKELAKGNIHTHHMAMNFEILPKLRDLINPFLKNKVTAAHDEGEYYVGMKNPPNTKLKGMLLVGWYAIDYFLGNLKLYQWKKRGDVTIFARYYYDYYFQRVHIYTPYWYIKTLEIIIPKPDFIFTIKRPAEDIFKLKPELSIEEIKRQQKSIDTLLVNKKNAFIIDGSKGIDDTVSKIFNIIYSL